MRLLFFFLSFLIFEKSAGAVVRPAVGHFTQLAENQPVKFSERFPKKAPYILFFEKKGPAFLRKNIMKPRPLKPGNGDRAAAASLVFGLATIVFLLLFLWILADFYINAAMVSIVLAVFFGIFALAKRTDRDWLVFGGLLSAAFSVLLGYVIYIILNDE